MDGCALRIDSLTAPPPPQIHVQSVDMFGSRVGFVKLRSEAYAITGSGDKVDVPGIVFMRGGSVSVLIVLECEGMEYTILTRQPRVPAADHNLPEIPAGTLDGSGNFRGVAAEEIEEECDIVIEESELVDMTELAHGDRWRGMVPSGGGCDEFIRCVRICSPYPPTQCQSALVTDVLHCWVHGAPTAASICCGAPSRGTCWRSWRAG
eukprot:COSAG01_NODE_1061_length_11887_cov_151.517557_13_plen_207_part_00